MKVDAKSIEELIEKSNFPELFNTLDQFMSSEFSQLNRYFFKGDTMTFVGYGKILDDKNNEWPLVCISPQKNSISLYLSGTKEGVLILEHYRSHFPKSALGKSCIRLKKEKDIDYDVLKQIINDAVVWQKNEQNMVE